MSHAAYQYCPTCRTALTTRRLGGRDRLACPSGSCGFVHWDNPAPVVAGIVERAGRVVLVRSHGWPSDWYGLGTRFLEPGEAPGNAIVREVQEEIGIGARLNAYLGAYPFEQINQIILAYHLIGEAGPIKLCEEELVDHKEVAIERLRPWSRGTGPAVKDWLASRGLHPPVIERTRPTD
ncbi:MAG: NUDIX domain-containing protein [Rhodospirillaceae bacterium]|nr:NUDIX domain-containing protein [Rhodospirillaceae bacterium]